MGSREGSRLMILFPGSSGRMRTQPKTMLNVHIDCGRSEQNPKCLTEEKLTANIKHIIQHPCEGPEDKERKFSWSE